VKAFLSSGPIRWLIAGGAFLIAAIAIGTTIMVDNFRERALSSNERELENTVLLVARHFDQQLEDFTIILKDITGQIHSDGMTAEIFRGQLATLEWHETLRKKVGAYSDIAGINVFDAGGTLINSSDVWPVSGCQNRRSRLLQGFQVRHRGHTGTGRTGAGRIAGGWATIIAHKVIGPKGEFVGVVARAIAPATFEKYFASVALGEGAAISMYHRDGTLLARYPHIERMIGSHVRTSPIYRFISSPTGRGTIRLTSPIDAQERVASALALKSFPIAIVASTTVAAALADWREQTRFLILVAAFSVLVITAMLILFVRNCCSKHRMEKHGWTPRSTT